ncbi:hypothetical protein SLEP1_g34786 [Rubroshorea leprosula]|uniref:Uncharacterized protein n=1 Tax=Rubroshorea leprosula TaxID=152421 RepID=A0AAV5KLF8_9ROSI|nr:hypothetical protein SLEP1_g34786 [Rubroshorea leprosula]
MATALQSSTRTAPVAFSRQFTGFSSSSRGSGSVSFPHNISINAIELLGYSSEVYSSKFER